MSSGTLAAQVINLLAIVLLARLYPPSEFGLLGIFYALSMALSPAVAGKLDEALVVTERIEMLPRVVAAAIRLSVIFSATIAILLIAVTLAFRTSVDLTGLGPWLGLMVPLGILLQGLFSIGSYYGVRNKQFAAVARVKFLQSVAVAVANLTVWAAGSPSGGLIFGTLIGFAVSVVLMFRAVEVPVHWRILVRDPEKPTVLSMYRDFPLYSAPGGVFYGISYQLPIIVISRYFSATVVGYYALLIRTAIAPLGFISVGIIQVNMRKVAEMAAAGRPILPYLLRVSAALSALMAIPTVVFMLWAPDIFAIIFGEKWREAGTYLQILMPALAVRLVATTFGGTLEATRNNVLAFIWKALAFISTAAVFLTVAPQGDIRTLLYAQLFLDMALYALLFLFVVYAAWRPRPGPPSQDTSPDKTLSQIGIS